MTLSIRSPEADALARQLAAMEQTTITDAVLIALKDAIRARKPRVDPIESAQRILAEHGLSFPPDRKPVPQSVYHDLDHDLTGEDD
ncbi:type II toxin-antitoxin system VapB family antitoxin [Cypionkella sp.]|jgi:antitoxin VapB|uniref:type II toxin-antitoxin system VapB family antitoxin n=1 Tax=Cypionkella sp. TaxID=2811411 RepID=UPI002ABA44DD|nr:type II toxin-antitoxin system VapB family antitoxin [Cypionkella sp.]MDZ4394887.1 type II toxin-antitoxin system VapB family antitoxin [Cypionkella sp.]